MKLKNYLIKKAYTYTRKDNNPEAVRMNNYLLDAQNNAGYRIPGQIMSGIDAPTPFFGMGPYKDKKIPVVFANDPSVALLSHEQGHVQGNHGVIPKTVYDIPIVGDVARLGVEAHANAKSWSMLKKMYGDDPKLLEAIKKDRQNTLPRAYSTYLIGNGIPLATSAIGGYLGYRYYNNAKKKLEEQRKALMNDKSLSKEELSNRLAKLQDPSKFRTIATGALLGYGGGRLLGLGLNKYVNSDKNLEELSRKSVQYNKDVGMQDMLVDHAKRNGYYREDADTDLSGGYNLY